MPTTEWKTIKGLSLHSQPLSFAHIKKIEALNGELANYLKVLASEDVYHRKWEFDGDSVIDDFWNFYADASATGFAVPTTQEIAGVLQGATGTTDNGGLGMLGQPVVSGDKRAFFHAHLEVSAITGLQIEAGLVDAVTDKTLPVVTDVDTPTVGNGGSDLAVVHMDTDQTLTSLKLVTANGGTAGGSAPSVAKSPAASTVLCVRVGLDVNDVTAIIDNARANRLVVGSGIEGGTQLMPWIYFRTRNTTSKTVKVRMVELMTER